ncbi:hypothetical protein M885DRAFT_167555 [Pelagophyceae sp. CCMP2097]|nr:hypothetical protein M885DRAFT_167555 [Pelagophyceae sp. CCMP2097]
MTSFECDRQCGTPACLPSGTPVGGALASEAAGEAGNNSLETTGWLESRHGRADALSVRMYSSIFAKPVEVAASTVQMVHTEATLPGVGSSTSASVHLNFGAWPTVAAGTLCWHHHDGGAFKTKTAVAPVTHTEWMRFHGRIAACGCSGPH